jgi:hypothetical protein
VTARLRATQIFSTASCQTPLLEVPVQKSRPTQNKRARERARQEKQQQKTARRLESKNRRVERPSGGEDPDIAGIVPGPQPSPWGEEGLLPPEEEEEGR